MDASFVKSLSTAELQIYENLDQRSVILAENGVSSDINFLDVATLSCLIPGCCKTFAVSSIQIIYPLNYFILCR